MTKKSISQKRLKEVLSYDPESGIFTWLAPASRRMKAGDVAGCLRSDSYTIIKVDNRDYKAHRLAFLYMTGSFPKDQTDHINHIRNDNRWENLREADRSLNRRNQSMFSNNTSGHTGIHWNKARRKWTAHISINCNLKYLGGFTDIADAIAARKAADVKHGFHPNHGKILTS